MTAVSPFPETFASWRKTLKSGKLSRSKEWNYNDTVHGPETADFGDDVFLACQSCNLSHTIGSEKIGNMGSVGQKSSD